MSQVRHLNLYNLLFSLVLLAASWSLTQGAITEKLDNTTQKLDETTPPSAVMSPDCTTCATCPTPCGGYLPYPPPEPPKEEQPHGHGEPSVHCPSTDPSAGCLPQPYYYTTGNPNALYPYKPYNYEYYNGCETQAQNLPMIMVLLAVLLSCWY